MTQALEEELHDALRAGASPYPSRLRCFEDELLRVRLLLAEQASSGAAGVSIEVDGQRLDGRQAAARLEAHIRARRDAGAQFERDGLPSLADLDADERAVVALAAGVELDPRTAGAVELVTEAPAGRGIDVALLGELLTSGIAERVHLSRKLLAAGGRLRRRRLVALEMLPDAGETARVRATRLGIAALVGVAPPDAAVEALTELHEPRDEPALVVSERTLERLFRFLPGPDLRRHADVAAAGGDESDAQISAGETRWPVVLVTGPHGVGKSSLVHLAARRLERSVREVPSDRLAGTRGLSSLLARLEDGAVIGQEVLHFDAAAALAGRDSAGRHELGRLLARHRVPVFLEATTQADLDGRVLDLVDAIVPLARPDAEERTRILSDRIPPEAPLGEDVDLALVAERSELNGRALARVASLMSMSRWARDGRAGDGGEAALPTPVTMADLDEVVALQLHGDLGELAERRTHPVRLDDLVLPAEEMAQIHEILEACWVRPAVLSAWGFSRRLGKGRGLCLLFHGEPGTGKTHSAEAIATELGLELYQVSLPRIVSKWVGETERNIERIFAAARQSRAVLLFDEADSLFATRTKVESSNDRYANMETNYLLQQIEHYDGVVVLTTNFMKNLDAAMERRIAYKMEFPFPDGASRALIWRRLIPPEAPLGADVDFNVLGQKYELSGGHIKNAVLRAACRAMAREKPMNMRILRDAAETEYRLSGRLVQQR